MFKYGAGMYGRMYMYIHVHASSRLLVIDTPSQLSDPFAPSAHAAQCQRGLMLAEEKDEASDDAVPLHIPNHGSKQHHQI